MKTIIKRCRQFARALMAQLTPADQALIRQILNKSEQNLFYQMDTAIQQHSVNVANTIAELLTRKAEFDAAGQADIDTELLFKAALLHDIGKSNGEFTIMDRVWYVIIRKASGRLAKRIAQKGHAGWLARLRNAFYIHTYHGEIGCELARRHGFPEQLVALISHHHNPQHSTDSLELKLLRQADELN